jgi:hypothetical protein
VTGPENKPEYRNRYPCSQCGVGYLDCAAAATMNLMCCIGCDLHPERFAKGAHAYTEDEINDMWLRAGRERP